ncbi:type IV secretory system conjugative DNA transfer family protein [Rothia sp. P4278]|uniref:type IV secretory system conjugative DNA transfer family protein n=1 Tax=Rothia sp. P4278 TaxID=3402658 RepID=UPI003AE31368
MSKYVDGQLLLLVAGCLLIVGFLGGAAAVFWVSFMVSCGAGSMVYPGPGPLLGAIFSGFDPAGLAAGECVPSQTMLVWVLVGFIVVVALLVTAVLVAWGNWKESDTRFLMDLKKRDGIAKGREVKLKAGRKALGKKANSIRPTMKKPKLSDVGVKLGSSDLQDVWQTLEDSVVVLGPPRSGKGFYLVVNRILDSPGAVITTSTRGDNVAMTYKKRQEVGPCIVFDPQGLSGVRSSLKWTPYRGCESPVVAVSRASALIGATSLGSSTNNAEWADYAKTILTYLLQAAALGKVSVATFALWGQNADTAVEAVNILRRSPDATPGWADALDGEIKSDPKTRGSRWMGVQGATAALSVPQVAETLDPKPGDKVLDPAEFIREKGTLYLVGSKAGGAAVAPFLIALMDEIVETARTMAFKLPGNRLDPPMSLVLDEIANMAPWKALPQIMADGGGVGISAFVIFQSPAQARGQWGEDEAQALIDSAILQIQLGGSNNEQELRRFSDLAGEREVETHSTSYSHAQGQSVSYQKTKVAVLPVSDLRRIPTGYGILLNRNSRPILMKMIRWIDRKDAKDIKESKKRFEDLMAGRATTIEEAYELTPGEVITGGSGA